MNGYHHDMDGWGWFFGGSLMMVLFAVLIGVAVYIAVRLAQRPPRS
jgi:uncharacterized membrane protein (DUF4010 family)